MDKTDHFCQKSQSSKPKKSKFWFDFVCGNLAKNVQARDLVKVKMDGERWIVSFTDIEKISLIYWEFKKDNDGKDLKKNEKSRKDNLKNILASLVTSGLLKKIGYGTDLEATEHSREYIKYEVLDGELSHALSMKYPVPRKRKMKRERGETSSDTGIEAEFHKPLLRNKTQKNFSKRRASTDSRDSFLPDASNSTEKRERGETSSDTGIEPEFHKPLLRNKTQKNFSERRASTDSRDSFLSDASNSTETAGKYQLVMDIRADNKIKTISPNKCEKKKCKRGETSSDTRIEAKSYGPFPKKNDFHESQASADTRDPFLSDASNSIESPGEDQIFMDVSEDNKIKAIIPNKYGKQGGCSFGITANQNLPEGKYYAKFEDYGTPEAFRSGTNFLAGTGVIPPAKKPCTHEITVEISNEARDIIGKCSFTYEDLEGDLQKELGWYNALESNDDDSFNLDESNADHSSSTSTKTESTNNVICGKGSNEKFSSRPVNILMLLNLCDEMAKRGDEHFFWALNELGVMGRVLEKRGKDLEKIAREHGHCEFALTVQTYLRKPFNDNAMKTLTFGNLIDAVRKERLLANSVLDSDSDLKSCSSGYIGDCDSEDDVSSINENFKKNKRNVNAENGDCNLDRDGDSCDNNYGALANVSDTAQLQDTQHESCIDGEIASKDKQLFELSCADSNKNEDGIESYKNVSPIDGVCKENLLPNSDVKKVETSMDDVIDEVEPVSTAHVIYLRKFGKDKKYEEKIVKEIIAAICATLNSSGGKVTIHFDTNDNTDIPVKDSSQLNSYPKISDVNSFPQISRVVRILRQSMISIIGIDETTSRIDFKEDEKGIIVSVNRADSLVTTSYHLYLLSQTQVVKVPPLKPVKEIRNFIHRKIVLEPVQLGTHCCKFFKDKKCGFYESTMCQLKHLKADPSRRTTLADRMISKGNKFSCYVSAFANHRGGHIYYGIRDDTEVVEGERIPNDWSKKKITKKVQKAINKMIWPEQIGQPKQGEQWEIFFEPVMDENSKPVPSTFVIVIYIAPCLGGVFTDVPECYEMVDGNVKKMSFATWKKRILQPVWLRKSKSEKRIPFKKKSFGGIIWSSYAVRKAFTIDCDELRKIVSNGNWEMFEEECSSLQNESDLHETMELLILFNQITACNRTGEFKEAQKLIDVYKALLPKVQDSLIFEVLGLYLEAALKRASDDLETVKELLTTALERAEWIEPGLVTATVYIFAATVSDLINLESPAVLTEEALKHLECVPDSSDVLAAMKRKAIIILATFHLGCNVSGQLIKNSIDISSLENAKTCIKAISESAYEEHPLSVYYDIQFNLVLSIYKYRHSQLKPELRKQDLRDACSFTKKAQSLAHNFKFTEMFKWSKNCETLCVEELQRDNHVNSSHHVRNDELSWVETPVHNHENGGIPRWNSCTRNVTQNQKFQIMSAKSQSLDDLNVERNSQVKIKNEKAQLGVHMEPLANTVQTPKAENSSHKQVQSQHNSPLPSSRQKERKINITHSDQPITWSSDAARKAFTIGSDELRSVISNGSRKVLDNEGQNSLQNKSDLRETMELVNLFKHITACNRRGELQNAHKFLEDYNALSSKVEDSFIFGVLGLYLEAALQRAIGNLELLKVLLTEALSKAEHIEPGLVTATVYIFAATVSDLINLESPAVLAERALKHLECVPDSSDVLAAMRRKAHIILATFHLGCNISGQLLKGSIDNVSLETAMTFIQATYESAYEEHSLSVYYDIQLYLVLAIFKYRRSQLVPGLRERELRNACRYAKKAQRLAQTNNLAEMFKWSKNNEALCTQELNHVRNNKSDQRSEERKYQHEQTSRGDRVEQDESYDRHESCDLRNRAEQVSRQHQKKQDNLLESSRTKSKSTDPQKVYQSQNPRDLNVVRNSQVKNEIDETLPCPDCLQPTSNNAVQDSKAQDSSAKQAQPQRDSVSPSDRQNIRRTHVNLPKFFGARLFQPGTCSPSETATHPISTKVSLEATQPKTSDYVTNNSVLPMHVVGVSPYEGSVSSSRHTEISPIAS